MKSYLISPQCACGKTHSAAIDDIIIGKGVIGQLPSILCKYQATKPFILADQNTYGAAAKQVTKLLSQHHIAYAIHVFESSRPEPDEAAVGSAIMHFVNTCDIIIGVGSGVINDIGKILSKVTGRKYIIVATAPSMDGYASATSSMSMDGLKVSLSTRCADVIIGDVDILKTAPDQMLKAGLGDMLAKYVAIAEWRISHLVTGEYYCEQIAQLIRSAVKKCTDNAEKLLRREDAGIAAVFEGLVIAGVAMAYAGLSRPASGVEHYISHICDMHSLAFGAPVELHGIQCAFATLKAVELYETLTHYQPDAARAAAFVHAFDYPQWSRELRSLLGKGADAMIALEQKEHKYDPRTHAARFQQIVDHWNEILDILREELPTVQRIRGILYALGIPTSIKAFGMDAATAQLTFKATKDIRDKYVLSRLAWDLGLIDELAVQFAGSSAPLPQTEALPSLSMLFTCPAVFAVADQYQIFIQTTQEAVVTVRVGNAAYHDASNGIMDSLSNMHKVSLPMSALDQAQQYVVSVRPVIERKPYFPQTAEPVEHTFAFHPVPLQNARAYHLADCHNLITEPIRAAQTFGAFDFLILNGDVIDHSGDPGKFDNIYLLCAALTRGTRPVVFSRGNHDMRGRYAERFADYTPNDQGHTYYTFRLGSIWGLVLDCGEDKDDSHPEYGHMVACHDFRLKQTEFLRSVIAHADSEYAAPGVTTRIIISHIPFSCKEQPPFDIEQDIYRQWCETLQYSIKPNLMICGHTHQYEIHHPGEQGAHLGHPCPVVVASKAGANHDWGGGGFVFRDHCIDVVFTDSTVGTIRSTRIDK